MSHYPQVSCRLELRTSCTDSGLTHQGNYYDDGYSSYPNTAPTPNPYDTHPPQPPNPYDQQPYHVPHTDPFAPPLSPPQPYHSPPPPGGHGSEYPNPFQGGYSDSGHISPPLVHSPLSQSPPGFQLHDEPSRYTLHDDPDNLDTGDIPLLNRNPSGMGMPIPGGYDPVKDEDMEESNIRYGRIPQRVPRRYKTIKKVELFHGNLVLDPKVPSKLLKIGRAHV